MFLLIPEMTVLRFVNTTDQHLIDPIKGPFRGFFAFNLRYGLRIMLQLPEDRMHEAEATLRLAIALITSGNVVGNVITKID